MNTLDSIVRNRLLPLCILLFASLAYAQEDVEVAITPLMKISNGGTQNPIRLDILKVDIKVVGQIAVTTFDMTFFNNNPRILQGEFNFPLAEGQTVTRFALDIGGSLREGV